MDFPPKSPPSSPKELRLQGPLWHDKEPCRKEGLIINSREPFNAEPPVSILSSSYLTNEDVFYKRNHGPVPILPDPTTSLPRYTVVATLQCAQNRRTEMSRRRKVRGLGWGPGAIGTAAWGGAKLSDVLKLAGVEYCSDITTRKGRHVEFVSCDFCKEEDGGPYKASIPMLHATTPESDALLAYEMNGKVLSRDHGYPLRAIVPGVIGARSVKWIETIIVSRFECQSVICEPRDGVVVKSGDMVDLYGYAVAGGGRGIERVDISVDNGKSWLEARRLPKLQIDAQAGYEDDPHRPQWAWTLWELKFVEVETPCIVVVKAVDTAANIQPAEVDEIWNLRGVLNNCWYKIRINAPCPPVVNL